MNLGSPLIDGIFLVQKMCICSCVTLSTTLLMRAVQFNARSACDASMFTSCIYIFLKIYIYTGKYRKIYIHDVNVDASQADRALNWTVRITKIYHQLVGYLWYELHSRMFGQCAQLSYIKYKTTYL